MWIAVVHDDQGQQTQDVAHTILLLLLVHRTAPGLCMGRTAPWGLGVDVTVFYQLSFDVLRQTQYTG